MSQIIKVTVWSEFRHEKKDPKVAAIYPRGIHETIAGFLRAGGAGGEECPRHYGRYPQAPTARPTRLSPLPTTKEWGEGQGENSPKAGSSRFERVNLNGRAIDLPLPGPALNGRSS